MSDDIGTQYTELRTATYFQEWAKAKAIIDHTPQIVWYKSSHGSFMNGISFHNNVDMLRYIHNTLIRLDGPVTLQTEMLRTTFEEPDSYSHTPAIHAAEYGAVDCLEYLVRICPSGRDILEVKNRQGENLAHRAAKRSLECLKFIVNNAPSGVELLEMKDHYELTPIYNAMHYDELDCMKFIVNNAPSGVALLDVKIPYEGKHVDLLSLANWEIHEYFTPQRIREIAFDREYRTLEAQEELDDYSLPKIIFGVLRDETELQERRANDFQR